MQIFWISLICEFWYLYVYNFIHKTTSLNIFISSVILFNFVMLFFFKKTKNYEKFAGAMFLMATVFISVLVYTAGAIKSPAPFTFALIPIGSAFFFGTRFLNASFVLCLTLFTSVMVLGEIYPTTVYQETYTQQKLANTILFIFVFYFLVRSFVKSNEAKDLEIQKQKDGVQNLLRILIHDVASPLSIAMGRVHRLEKEGADVESIKRALNNAACIIGDVRRLEEIGNGKVELSLDEFSLNTLLSEIKSEVSSLLENKKLQLEINIPEGLSYTGDYSLLKNNVFRNLLTNAIKFSEEGQVIKIDCTYESTLDFTITDQGEGIPPEVLENIFSPDKPTTRRGTKGERGSGFGMPIVKKVIEMMGGEINITSNYPSPENEVGTIIKISLPNLQKAKMAA